MSSLSCKNVKIQDTNGNVASTITWDGNNVTFDKPVLVPTAAAGTNNTQVATTAFAMGAGLGGSNQTWQNVGSNRALGTTYTNSTGKPILVVVMCGGTQSADLMLSIDGSIFIHQCVYANSAQAGTVYGIIPNGSTYSASISAGSATGLLWRELR
jgi:hypothetical protein